MSSTKRGPAGPSALLPVATLATLLLGAVPTIAQDAGGGISTTIPTLRGADGGTAGGAPAFGSPATGEVATPRLPTDGGVGTSASPATVKPPRGRFAPVKGTAKTDDRTREPRRGPPPLPPLQAYPTAARLRGAGAAIDTVGDTIPPGPTVAALPVATRLRSRIEDTPYDPVGIDVGSLRLTPSVTQSLGYDSNPDQAQTRLRPSAYERTDASLGVVSTWSRNELRADLRGGYSEFFSAPDASRPDASGTVDYRYDVDRNSLVDAQGRFALATQRIGSPEVSAAAQTRPLITTYGASLGGSETLGRLTVALHGSVDRTNYENATDSAGVVQNLSSQSFNDYGLRMRATYEVTPVLRPFVDVLVDQRVHDQTIDYTGYRRDSNGVTGQLGSSFELTRLLAGEISGGFGNRSYQDSRLKDINGPVVNGVLTYAATPLTIITARAATSFDETTVSGSSGTTSRSATIEISHALLRNLTITGALSYLNTNYVGVPITENTLAETLRAEYHLSRSLVAVASFSHEQLTSTLAGAGFTQEVALLGLRWQR